MANNGLTAAAREFIDARISAAFAPNAKQAGKETRRAKRILDTLSADERNCAVALCNGIGRVADF